MVTIVPTEPEDGEISEIRGRLGDGDVDVVVITVVDDILVVVVDCIAVVIVVVFVVLTEPFVLVAFEQSFGQVHFVSHDSQIPFPQLEHIPAGAPARGLKLQFAS